MGASDLCRCLKLEAEMTDKTKAIEALNEMELKFMNDDLGAGSFMKLARTIRAALQGVEASASNAWRPIESAPRDGTDIIVYRPNFSGDYIPQVGVDYWGVKSPQCWRKSNSHTQPTHWQPLPLPPTKGE